jgi:hypothetical protein
MGTFTGRYPKGVNRIRVEAFGDKLIVLPVWRGGVQDGPTSRSRIRDAESAGAVFTFTNGSLTFTGHRKRREFSSTQESRCRPS